MQFGEMKYGQLFILSMGDTNMWVKIPTMEEPETDDQDKKMVNAILVSGDEDDAIFEFFEDDVTGIGIAITSDDKEDEQEE